MKKFLLSLSTILLFSVANSQVFWTEAFQNGCGAACFANAYIGPNGAWTQTSTGTNDLESNKWFVSGAECGNAATQCGSVCGGTDPSLHIGADDGFTTQDAGASYNAGGLCPSFFCVITNMRIESPTINCTGQSTITLAFNYIENGDGTIDDATLWYYNGATWAQIDPLAKPPLGACAPQGRWTAFSILLPASANNNPNVKIGFNWTNNDDGVGTDPSFAVDDITLSVTGGAPPVASFSVSATTICVNACVNFTDQSANAPTSWSWTFPGATPNSSVAQNPNNICYNTAGTYTATLTATNANGSSSTSQTITVNPLPTANAGPNVTICQSASTTLAATGGGTYLWSPVTGLSNPNISNPVASPTISTNYTVTVTNSCGSSTSAVIITVNPLPVANAGPDITVCPGTNVTLTASGGSTYSWWNNSSTTSSISVSPAITTGYTVTVTNSCGSSTAAVNVVISGSITAVITGNTTICQGESTTLAASGGINYSWSTTATTSSIIVNPASSTSYSVIASAGTCADTASVTVNVIASPTPTISGSTTLCAGNSATLTALGGNTYSWWNNGSTASTLTVSPSSTTTYTVTATNANGCTAATTAIVTVASASVSGNNILCQGQSATLSASGGTTYSWNTTQTIATITVSPTTTTSYTVIVSAGTCTDTASTTVTVNSNPSATASSDTTISQGTTVTLSASGGGNYSWSNGSSAANISVSPNTTTVYCVTVTNASNCTDIACVTVTVELLDCGDIFVPNAFSPNNDGQNESECVLSKCIKTFFFSIYDRWGEKVFSATGGSASGGEIVCWDGKYKGKLMNSATYVYYLEATLTNGEQKSQKGNISLIR